MTTRDKLESEILNAILLDHGNTPGVRLFRNNTGKLPDRNGRQVTFGLCKGGSDIIGIVTTASGPVGVFLAAEVKSVSGTPSAEQLAFLRMVRDMGGVSGIVRSSIDMGSLILEAQSL